MFYFKVLFATECVLLVHACMCSVLHKIFLYFFSRRLINNNFICDCHLLWLPRFLRSHRGLGLYTECNSPSHLQSMEMVDIPETQFKCQGISFSIIVYCFQSMQQQIILNLLNPVEYNQIRHSVYSQQSTMQMLQL